MNDRELLRIKELEANGYVAVGGPRRQNDEWDADICPAALSLRRLQLVQPRGKTDGHYYVLMVFTHAIKKSRSQTFT
jgi:hypothetical protein